MIAQQNTNTLYRQVVAVTADYLGPASERFIDRQIQTHLHKQPDQLRKEDIAKLANWIEIVVALLTEDDETVRNFTRDLRRLGRS